MTEVTSTECTRPDSDHDSDFTDLYTRHYARVLAYARRRSPDEPTARDITAETFTTAWRRLPDALSGGLPWLYTTAGLHLRNHHRVSARARATTARLAAQPPSQRAESADPLEQHADTDLVRRAVRSLPDGERELLMLTLWEHLDVATAAGVVGCSPGAAHVRLHRARRRLRTLLSPLHHRRSAEPAAAPPSGRTPDVAHQHRRGVALGHHRS